MKVEGWFTYVEDHEYGPTLVRYKGEGKPTKEPNTACNSLDDPDWEEVYFFEEWREHSYSTDPWTPHHLEFIVSTRLRTR